MLECRCDECGSKIQVEEETVCITCYHEEQEKYDKACVEIDELKEQLEK